MSFKLNKEISDLIFIVPGVIILVLSLISAGCVQDRETNVTAPDLMPLIIACTIPPQAEFISEVGGGWVTPLILVPPGASPHTYEPTPSQIRDLENSAGYITLGSGMEFERQWLGKIRDMFPDLKIVNSSENISLMEMAEPDIHDDEGHAGEHTKDGHSTDPHIWLSPLNAEKMVRTTAETLINLQPEHRGEFEANRDRYLAELEKMDVDIRSSISGLKSRTVLVYHPAYGYFCRDYNLTQLPIEANGKEPTGQALVSLIDKARSEGISVLLIEPETSAQGAETIVSAINATIVEISPLSPDYLQNMRKIAKTLSSS